MRFTRQYQSQATTLQVRLLALASSAFLAVGCAAARDSASLGAPSATHSANVLLITVDTLRADHLPVFGYNALTTPAFDRLASEGVTFKAAYSSVPLTLPSHTTILTGLLPPSHHVRDNGEYLESTVPTLASRLKERGYAAAAFVSSFVLDRRWGLSRGFDDYYDSFVVSVDDLAAMARVQRRGDATWAQARQWISTHAAEPFFVWMHLFDPHTPYDPPEPFRTQFADRAYDGEIAYVDSILSEVLRELTLRSLVDKTMIVLVSDHGEGLGDHGEDEHGLLAYDSTLHVPWILRLPNRQFQNTSIRQAVSLADVTPTILDLVGVPASVDLDGRSLVPLVRSISTGGADVAYAETLYPRLQFGWSELLSVRNDRFKLIRGQRRELFDYRDDPKETKNLIDTLPEVSTRLDQIIERIATKEKTPIRRAGVSNDVAGQLSALGYFAGSPLPMPRGPLADPRDKTESFRALAHSRQLLATRRDVEGFGSLQRLVMSDPMLTPAHRVLREAWITRGRTAEAARWLRTQLVRDPGNVRLHVDLAVVERSAGHVDRAVSAINRALAIDAADIEVLTVAAEVQRDARHLQDALDLFTRAAAIAPSDSNVRMQVARTLFAMEQIADAEAAVTAALAADRHTAGAHYLLAQIAERRNDSLLAEREYRLDIAESPWDYRARFNLAILLGQRGDHRESLELLESIPRLAPTFGEVYFYVAKAILDSGQTDRFPAAIDAANKGLRLAPGSSSAPLGHYVLGDILRLQGRRADSEREIRLGRELENRISVSGQK